MHQHEVIPAESTWSVEYGVEKIGLSLLRSESDLIQKLWKQNSSSIPRNSNHDCDLFHVDTIVHELLLDRTEVNHLIMCKIVVKELDLPATSGGE